MKTKLLLLAVGCSPWLTLPAGWAQTPALPNGEGSSARTLVTLSDTNLVMSGRTNLTLSNGTNAAPRNAVQMLPAEQLLLSPGLKAKLKLTDAQQAELAPFELEFAKTSQEFQTANQPRIDAAMEAHQQARVAKNEAQIQAANAQMQNVWAGLKPYRGADLNRIKLLLTPAQLKILDDPNNQ